MDLEFVLKQTIQNSQANFIIINLMELELNFILMAKDLKVNLKMEKKMELEFFIQKIKI